MRIFFDLDGTLLDVSERHFRVYHDILAPWRDRPLPKSRYWDMKRMGAHDAAILAATGARITLSEFSALKGERLELDEYLKLDVLFEDVSEVLISLRPRCRLFMVTLRRDAGRLDAQLRSLGISPFFESVHSAFLGSDYETKDTRLQELGCGPEDFVVGDSEADVLAGKALGARTVAVTTGVRGPAVLEALGPEFLIHSLRGLVAIVAEASAIRSQAHG